MTSDWADRTLRGMPLERKAAQLLMPRISGEFQPIATGAYEQLLHWVQTVGVGGVVVTVGPPLELAMKLNMLQAAAAVPLLVSADMEHGPGQVLNAGTVLPYGLENGGGTRFPPLMALAATGDEAFAYELGRITALEARAAGIHAAFAPVVDVNNNPENPIINTRSYSSDPDVVAGMAVAHVRGLQDHGMLSTAKHFPGHGDTSTDSHLELPCITVDRSRVDAIELVPYRAVVAAAVAGVMSAHIAFPALTGDAHPATLSRSVLTGLLRGELGFGGLVFTDALDMGAIVREFGAASAAVMALAAGADVLLQPSPDQVDRVVEAIVQAVHANTIPEERLDESVLRVLQAKQLLGLQHEAAVDLNALMRTVGVEDHLAVARRAAARSITAVRDEAGLLPLGRKRLLLVNYSADHDRFAGRTFQRELAAGSASLDVITLCPRPADDDFTALAEHAAQADVVVFAPYIHVYAGRDTLAMPAHMAERINHIATQQPVVLVSFGNPYIIAQFPRVGTVVMAWAQWEPMQTAAARAVLGRSAITGRLPVPLPPSHEWGSGIDIPASAVA